MMLLATVLGPLLLAVLALLAPSARLARGAALAGGLLVLAIGAGYSLDFLLHPGADFRGVWSWPWLQALGSAFTLGVDGPAALLLCLSGLVATVATVLAWHEAQRPQLYHALVLGLLAAVDAVFTALDLVVFYAGFELTLVPMLLLIGWWGGAQRRYAARKFVVFTLAGSVPLLLLLGLLFAHTPQDGVRVAVPAAVVAAHQDPATGTVHGLAALPSEPGQPTMVLVPRSFDLRHLALAAPHWQAERLAGGSLAVLGFLCVLLACLVKIPGVPLHTWLPHAHVQAPTPVSVLLAGVLLKLGVFGLYRVALPLFPGAAAAALPWLGLCGALGATYGALVALGQRDLKRLVAYASVSHMGFCLLGFASGSAAGCSAALVQAFTHGLGSALLFLLVGALYDRAHHRDRTGFGGLAQPMPAFGWWFLFAAMAGIGLPGLAGFPGEFLALSAAFAAPGWLSWCALLTVPAVVLSAAYLLLAYRQVVTGPLRHAEHAAFADLDRRERLALWPLGALLLLFGLWPGALLAVVRPACALLAALLEVAP